MLNSMLMCLALNVYHEARSDDMLGQYAVAHVVMNRVQHDKFPDDTCAVVHQGYHKGKHKCQFSWYCDGKSDTPHDPEAWAWAVLVAYDVLPSRVPDPTYGATHYHATYVKPYWADHYKQTVTLGSHIFYK